MTQIEKLKNKVATRPPVTSVWDFFESRKSDIAKVLPRHITADRLIGVMSFMIKSNGAIANASVNSLIAAVIQTCQLGLEPGSLGHVYYVPFNNKGKKEVQFIIGYKGYIELLNKAGKAAILSTECVYENDHFRYQLGLNPILEHTPAASNRGKFIGVYCIAKNLVANEKVFLHMSADEIDKIRKSSKAGASEYSPWNNWFESMAKKTVIRQITKLLPLSIEEQSKIATDETTKSTIDVDMTRVPDETVYEPSGEEIPSFEATAQATEAGTTQAPVEPADLISEAQRKRLFAILKEKKISDVAFKAYLKENYGYESRTLITKNDYVDINLWLDGSDATRTS